MSGEILLFKARIAARKDEFEKLNDHAQTLMRDIRDLLDLYRNPSDYTSYDLKKAKNLVEELQNIKQQGLDIKKLIAKMESELE